MDTTTRQGLSAAQAAQFERDGYLIVRGFLSREEAVQRRDHFMELHARGSVPGYFEPLSLQAAGGDMLRAYPRMLQPHRWDETSRGYLLDERLEPLLSDMMGAAPLGAQSMVYYKPPGARGQALHQDDFYLRTAPQQCLAAWLSLEDTDSENGGLFVVPGSHRLPLLCPHAADLRKSFTIEEVAVPVGMEPVAADLALGDMLFFSGNVIQGSWPNVTTDRFRRSFICHYVPSSIEVMSQWYRPLLTFDGREVERGANSEGGPCGTTELEALRAGLMAQGELAQAGIEQGAISKF
jgi:ectoine hydroxylase-related dioxygenase (phytanoyl-CoA dioxygenase family)